ncbi:hypothetical protein TWF281_001172 [Arthrobotrys megalospora]
MFGLALVPVAATLAWDAFSHQAVAKKLENLEVNLGKRMDGQDKRMDRQDARMDRQDARMDRLEDKMGKLEEGLTRVEMGQWGLGKSLERIEGKMESKWWW